MKYIKMNQSNEDFEIPVPWFLIRHPKGDVVIDGGNAKEVSKINMLIGVLLLRLMIQLWEN